MYDGSAYVLFEKNNKLFEVYGGHCSCFGLEGQFNPEEITIRLFTKSLEMPITLFHTWKCGLVVFYIF